MSVDAELSDFIRRMPKVELHVHLEGAIRAPTLLQLAKRRSVELPAGDVAGIERWLEFRDFDHFLEVYLTISRCLRDPEDFQLITAAFLEEQARQNIRHTEAHFTISTHIANGVNAGEVAEALAETVLDGERNLGVRLRWIPDIVRNVDPSRADQTLEWALSHRDHFVAAIGLSGKESHAAAPFREHFEVAKAEGLHRAVHAGEQSGPATVWEALELCGAERIGHGIRAVDDPDLVDELRRRRIPLEVNPTSNVCLGLVASLAEHPIRVIREEGLSFSINSDDPALFHTSLTRELELVAGELALNRREVASLSTAALDQAFLTPGERDTLAGEFAAWFEKDGLSPDSPSG